MQATDGFGNYGAGVKHWPFPFRGFKQESLISLGCFCNWVVLVFCHLARFLFRVTIRWVAVILVTYLAAVYL